MEIQIRKPSNTIFNRLNKSILRKIPKDGSLIRNDQLIGMISNYHAFEVLNHLENNGTIIKHRIAGHVFWGRL